MRPTNVSPIHPPKARALAGKAARLVAALVCLGACSRETQKPAQSARPSRDEQVQALADQAVSYRRAGQTVKAREAAAEALRVLEPATTRDDPQVWRLETSIAKSFALEGQLALAIEHYRRALAAAVRHPQQLRKEVVASHIGLSGALLDTGDGAAATISAESALSAAEQSGEVGAVTHQAISHLAAIYLRTQRADDAQRLLAEKSGLLRVWHPPSSAPESAPWTPAALQPRERGRVVISFLSVRLSDVWAYCAAKARNAGQHSTGTAQLSAAIESDGRVKEVVLTAFGLGEQAADCMVRETAVTKFPRPESGSAVIVFATQTFP